MESRQGHPAEASVGDGLRLQQVGKFDEAARIYRAVLRAAPRHQDALHLLGVVEEQRGRRDRAEKLIRRAILQSGGTVAPFHNNLGNLLRRGGRFHEAELAYRRALDLLPTDEHIWINLALLHHQRGSADALVETLRAGTRACPGSGQLWDELGVALVARRQSAAAAAAFERAVAVGPDVAERWVHLGNAWITAKHYPAAAAAFGRALQLDPTNDVAKVNLSSLLLELASPQDAERLLLESIRHDPDRPEAFGVLANVYKDLGYVDLALDCYARALTLDLSTVDYSNFLYTLLYDPGQDDREVADEHREWARTFADPHRPADPAFENDRDLDRPLRVGYVSGHFREHAVAFFSLPIFEAHDRTRFQIIGYDNTGSEDGWTERFKNCCVAWRPIASLTDDAAAEMIRADRIDILVDLTGHIGGNRLLIFARKPAPLQVTYLGYQATSGMAAMDYRLTDAVADPPGLTEPLYVESLLRLEPSFFVYLPSEYAPPVSPSPFDRNGHVTFGCLNNPTKITAGLVDVWVSVLRQVPGSRLLLLGPSVSDADPRVAKLFDAAGIAADRLTFVGKRPRAGYLEAFGEIDVGLDPFPFSGHTTTCDALWQGVPVVTLAGRTYAGRMTASTLRQAGLPHLIAESPDEYVKIAADLAADRPALAASRRSMRDHLRSSPMLDAGGFTRGLEAAYRTIWTRWCEAQPTAG